MRHLPASTSLLADVHVGPGSSAPRTFLFARDGTLFFSAGVPHRGHEPFAADPGAPPP